MECAYVHIHVMCMQLHIFIALNTNCISRYVKQTFIFGSFVNNLFSTIPFTYSILDFSEHIKTQFYNFVF